MSASSKSERLAAFLEKASDAQRLTLLRLVMGDSAIEGYLEAAFGDMSEDEVGRLLSEAETPREEAQTHTVWALTTDDGEDWFLHGVYSSERKSIAARMRIGRAHNLHANIEEWTLDKDRF